MQSRIEVFVCYAHEDEALRQGLEKQLRVLKRQGLIDVWHDREILAGMEWEQEIDKHLNPAQVILLLVSSDFIVSDYCYGIELQKALQRHERGEACVIPIILRPVYWQGTPFRKLKALPTDGRPITSSSWHSLDEAFFNVAEGIREVIEKLSQDTNAEYQHSPFHAQTPFEDKGPSSQPVLKSAEQQDTPGTSQAIKPQASLSPSSTKRDTRGELHRKFWEQLLVLAKARGVTTHSRCSATDDNWLGASFGRPGSGFSIEYQAFSAEMGINLVIDTRDKELNKRLFDQLLAQRERIEADFGGSLEWKRGDNSRRSNIQFVMKEGGIRADESKWPAMQLAMVTAMSKFSNIFAQYLSNDTNNGNQPHAD